QAFRETGRRAARSGVHRQGCCWPDRPGAPRRVRPARQRRLPAHRRGSCSLRVPTGLTRLMPAAPGSGGGSGGRPRPLIGVMGGLGPAATVDFYAKVVAATRAASDQDHVRLIIDADPTVPDRSASVTGTGESSAPALVAKALRLAAAGADVLTMPC